MFRKLLSTVRKVTTITAIGVATLLATTKPVHAQYAAPQLFQRMNKLSKTNSYPYNTTNLSLTVGLTFTNGVGRSTTCINLSANTGINATNRVDFIDQTDTTTNSVNFTGISSNVLDCLCMVSSSNDVLVVSTNQSTAGTGISILNAFRKQ